MIVTNGPSGYTKLRKPSTSAVENYLHNPVTMMCKNEMLLTTRCIGYEP